MGSGVVVCSVVVGSGVVLVGSGVVLVGSGVVLVGSGVVLIGSGVVLVGSGVVLLLVVTGHPLCSAASGSVDTHAWEGKGSAILRNCMPRGHVACFNVKNHELFDL
jgi:hypothetical protein